MRSQVVAAAVLDLHFRGATMAPRRRRGAAGSRWHRCDKAPASAHASALAGRPARELCRRRVIVIVRRSFVICKCARRPAAEPSNGRRRHLRACWPARTRNGAVRANKLLLFFKTTTRNRRPCRAGNEPAGHVKVTGRHWPTVKDKKRAAHQYGRAIVRPRIGHLRR